MSNATKPGGIWTCKIGDAPPLMRGADLPMRNAIAAAFKEATGQEAAFIFSGWDGQLTATERAVVNDELADFAIDEDNILEQIVLGARTFCERCRKGEIRSVKTYNMFKDLLEQLDTIRRKG